MTARVKRPAQRPLMRANRRPSGRDEIVESLLDAADRLFSESGPADVSLREIAREAHVNHGMVHRHFGTRDDLVEALLARTAARWTAEARSAGDFTSAINLIFGPPEEAESSAGSWIRLLAWSLLIDAPARAGLVEQRYATLDLLPDLLTDEDPEDAVTATAAALSLVFGWRFFHPYIRGALHLDEQRFARLHDAMRRSVRKLLRD